VSVVEPEAYVFDEEVLKKAADLGKPGLVEIKQLQEKFIFRVEGTGVLPVRGSALGWLMGGVSRTGLLGLG
jgi:DNA-directed RNA polymerase II subunit RPB3